MDGDGRPRAVRLPPHNPTLDLRSHGASRSRRGGGPWGEIRTEENGCGQPERKSRRNPQHPPDRRTNAFASAVPVKAPGAPLHHDNRPRAGPSVATVGRRSAGGPQFPRYRPRRAVTMRNPDPHYGSGARRRRAARSTSTTPRVLTDAAARAACRRPCPGRHPPRARGPRATRGPRPPPQEHSRTATDRRPPTLPDAAETATGASGPQPPCATEFSLNPTPNATAPMTTKENPVRRQKNHHPRRPRHHRRVRAPHPGGVPPSGQRPGYGRAPGRRAARVPRLPVPGRRGGGRLPPAPLVGERGPDAVTKLDGRHPAYLRARDEAFGRSNGICQMCGAAVRPATRW